MKTTQHITREQYQKGFAQALVILGVTVLGVLGYLTVNVKTETDIPVVSAPTVTSTTTDAEARAQFKSANICNYPNEEAKRSDCVNHPEPQTSLKGIHQAVITEVINFKKACDAWMGSGGSCVVVVTGGTETTGGHSEGACGHLTGDKVDLKKTDSVKNYILAEDSAGDYVNFTSIGFRKNGTALYKNKTTGVTYAQESTHWDIGGVGCTKTK